MQKLSRRVGANELRGNKEEKRKQRQRQTDRQTYRDTDRGTHIKKEKKKKDSINKKEKKFLQSQQN